jgi:D-alanyl-lipoteichoic acid acyltransferase DltB (MBOAT superfamily)
MNRTAVAFFLAMSVICAIPILRGSPLPQIAAEAAVVAATGAIGWALWFGKRPAAAATKLYWSGIAINLIAAVALHFLYKGWTLLFLVNGIVFLFQLRAGARPDTTGFLAYNLFLPRTIAGPIVGYRSFGRRLQAGLTGSWNPELVERGAIFLAVGLAKMVILGGEIERYIAPVFAAADAGVKVGGTDAWLTMIANYLQLYLQLSGACDIACGVLLMIGVRLPLSFHAPLRATNVASFWRRYHRTLGAFVRVYLYRPFRFDGRVSPSWAAIGSLICVGLWLAPSLLGIVWALLQSAALVVDRAARRWIAPRLARYAGWGGWIATQLFMAVTALFLRTASLGSVGSLLDGLQGNAGFALPRAMLNFFSREQQKLLVFTDAPLIANHALGLISIVLLIVIGGVAALTGPALDVSTRGWRRVYFVLVIYFVLGLALRLAEVYVPIFGVRL